MYMIQCEPTNTDIDYTKLATATDFKDTPESCKIGNGN